VFTDILYKAVASCPLSNYLYAVSCGSFCRRSLDSVNDLLQVFRQGLSRLLHESLSLRLCVQLLAINLPLNRKNVKKLIVP